MILFIITFILGLAMLAWGIYMLSYRHPSDYDEGTVKIAQSTFLVDLADTMAKRSQGLSGREPLKEDEGMYFIFPSSTPQTFWMKDMKFAIDIVWIREGKITGVTAEVPPPGNGVSGYELRPSPGPVDAVLEIGSGLAAKLRMGEGDAVTIKKK